MVGFWFTLAVVLASPGYQGTAVSVDPPPAVAVGGNAPQGPRPMRMQASMAMISGKELGYLVLPGKYICDAEVTDAQWSTKGRFLVLQRQSDLLDRKNMKRIVAGMSSGKQPSPGSMPVPENSIVVYDNDKEQLVTAWRSKKENQRLGSLTVGSSYAYVLIKDIDVAQNDPENMIAEETLARVSLSTGKIDAIHTCRNGRYIAELCVDRLTDSAFFTEMWVETNSALPDGHALHESHYLYGPKGLYAFPTSALPPLISSVYCTGGFFWVQEKPKTPILRVNPTTGEVTPWQGDVPEEAVKPAPFVLWADVLPIKLKNVKGKANTLFAGETEEAKDQTILTTNVTSPYLLAPDYSAIFYVCDGIGIIRDLIPVDKQVVKAAREAAMRSMLLSNVKQIGIAIIIYSCDNDDMIPGGMTNDMILPYLKDASLLEGFIFVFKGGTTSSFEKPAETELGYIENDQGRAVVYMDGHAKWIAK